MSVDYRIYDERFFRNTVAFEAASAHSVVRILSKYFSPRSVIDIGCGAGVYLEEFMKNGVTVLGVEGSPAALKVANIKEHIIIRDLCQPLRIPDQFDLCLCLEVAEHLPPACSEILVENSIKLSDTIVFTAATPGQGPASIGHINEQPPEYWLKKYSRFGYRLDPVLTEKIKGEMEIAKVVWWIVKNMMILKKLWVKKI